MRLRLRGLRLCLRLRRRWALISDIAAIRNGDDVRRTEQDNGGKIKRHPSQPDVELLRRQSEWLKPARSRLLRRHGIAHKKAVLDLGAGFGHVSVELARRSSGLVIALDNVSDSLRKISPDQNIQPIGGEAAKLPFANSSFDFIFCQWSLVWMNPLHQVITEIERTLCSDGVVVAIEPDFGGMIEYPQEIATKDIWISALYGAGADPLIGRKLPRMLEAVGLSVRVDLLETLTPQESGRFDYLTEILETNEHRLKIQRIVSILDHRDDGAWQTLVHLPVFLISARKSS